ncbi:hypothetical protein ACHAQH_002690 [Verticillium albo-atrum]
MPTETGFSALTLGCSDEDEKTSGTEYTTHWTVADKVSFTMFCNFNAPPLAPLLALAVPDFDRCMDACAMYTRYIKGTFESESDSVNATCTAISFVPGWTSKEAAANANVEGNCYLKSGPQRRSALEPVKPGIGETHAALLADS